MPSHWGTLPKYWSRLRVLQEAADPGEEPKSLRSEATCGLMDGLPSTTVAWPLPS